MIAHLRYYEAFGETKAKILELIELRAQALPALFTFARRFGVQNISLSTSMTPHFGLVLKRSKQGRIEIPDRLKPLWRFERQDHYDGERVIVPRLGIKAGKLLAKEMRELAEKLPSTDELCKLLRFNRWGDFPYIRNPKAVRVGKRVLVIISSEKYKPPKGVSLVRISDLEFEKLTRGGVAKAADYV